MSDIVIRKKMVGETLVGYFCSYNDRIVFLDLSTLVFFRHHNDCMCGNKPMIYSWSGFSKEKSFFRFLSHDLITENMSLEYIENMIKIYLLDKPVERKYNGDE